jgi:hypothetical protein
MVYYITPFKIIKWCVFYTKMVYKDLFGILSEYFGAVNFETHFWVLGIWGSEFLGLNFKFWIKGTGILSSRILWTRNIISRILRARILGTEILRTRHLHLDFRGLDICASNFEESTFRLEFLFLLIINLFLNDFVKYR